jgi:carbamoyltransferase
MNSVANGKIRSRTGFTDVFIQPASGDNGTALGAAFEAWHRHSKAPRAFVMEHGYWGPDFSDAQIAATLDGAHAEIQASGCVRRELPDERAVAEWTARQIADGRVIGWFQGRMEWGARALGNRSILADPRRADMREIINTRIKFRERFRPFAPSILEEAVQEYFIDGVIDPFMLHVYPIRPEKRALVPAITHVDGSGRLQTVSRRSNPLYWTLINAFRTITGVPMLLNTSFNENEPIVLTPAEALDCFLRTSMDVIVLGRHVLERAPVAAAGGAPGVRAGVVS